MIAILALEVATLTMMARMTQTQRADLSLTRVLWAVQCGSEVNERR